MQRLIAALIGFATLVANANNNHPANSNLAVITRDAPSFDDEARIEGSVRQLRGQTVTIDEKVAIFGDYLVPGTPEVRVDEDAYFGGIQPGSGGSQPSNYQVIIKEEARLRYLRTKTDPMVLSPVSAPPEPSGTRKVTLYRQSQSAGDFTTLKNLTLKRSAGLVAVPPGTYGKFKVGDRNNGLVFGVVGSSTPAVYNLQELELGSRTQLRVVGPVILTVARGFKLRGILGTSGKSEWLELRVVKGYIRLYGGSCIYGAVRIPSDEVRMWDNSLIVGNVHCRQLEMEEALIEWASAGFDELSANSAPTADSQQLTLNENASLAITLTGSDADGDALAYVVVDSPDHGVLTGTVPNLTYTPAANYHGSDQFRFKVNDGQEDSALATVSLTIRPIPTFPVETNKAVIVRHAPIIHGISKVNGSIHQLLGEDVSLSGSVKVFGDYCARELM